ncbi:MAG: phosphatase PAP2 family protein [Flavobacteriales bacterium]
MSVIKTIFIILFLSSTFLKAQIKTAEENRKKMNVKSFIVPAALFTTGVLAWKTNTDKTINDYRNDHYSDFNSKLDDITQFAPMGLVYAMPALGLKPKNDFWNRTVLGGKSIFITLGMTYSLKNILGRKRPYGAPNAFPSGHTAFAFMGAEMLHQEYKDSKPWVSYMGYALASQVALYRVLNNKHWFGDVLAGSAMGILGTKIAYLTHKFRWTKGFGLKENQLTILPNFFNKGIYVSFRF